MEPAVNLLTRGNPPAFSFVLRYCLMSATFSELLEARWDKGFSVCVGLDSDLEKLPESVRTNSVRESIVGFNRAIVDATKDLACAYKPNAAFYEAHGDEGWKALRETVQYIQDQAPEVPVILDSKRADIGNTNLGYVEAFFNHLRVDAITVPAYLGQEALLPFLEREEKGIFVLCRTSNPGAAEFQDLEVGGEPLYLVIAQHVASEWNSRNNCGLVVGATYPEELENVRASAKELPILLPGIGAQNGDLKKSVRYGTYGKGRGLIVAVSRAIIFASKDKNFAEAARAKVESYNRDISDALVQ
jgi:orotidine-5'-phosphate decarboxylase